MDHQEPRHEVHQCVIVHTESSIGPLKAAVVKPQHLDTGDLKTPYVTREMDNADINLT